MQKNTSHKICQPKFRPTLNTLHDMDETSVVEKLIAETAIYSPDKENVFYRAYQIVDTVRKSGSQKMGIDAFMHEYELSNHEGVTLMCLAEALLRIPDDITIDNLIRDKMTDANWTAHLGHSPSKFVNASTWAMMLTGKVLDFDQQKKENLRGFFKRLVNRSGEPVIRKAMVQAMRILGHQFVMGRTIKEALKRAKSDLKNGYRHSFDMLGEGARTDFDAKNYMAAYFQAIEQIKIKCKGQNIIEAPGISVKLSAIHPRFEEAKIDRVRDELIPRILDLAIAAKNANIGLCIDAEETWRQDLTLDVFEHLLSCEALEGWDGLGMAIQAYQKRATAVIDWVVQQARSHNRKIMVRLVKGAYWDTEIKRAQELGLASYPVFTRKPSTDLSYLVCAKKLLDAGPSVFPQFATHNAHTLASILSMVDDIKKAGITPTFEFQRLHGMGEALYDQIVKDPKNSHPCRIYAPVGSHEDLLAYLVRRLLENGANTSFVNRLKDEKAPIKNMINDPVDTVKSFASIAHPMIELPTEMFNERPNSKGQDVGNRQQLHDLFNQLENESCSTYDFTGHVSGGKKRSISSPQNLAHSITTIIEASPENVIHAIDQASLAFTNWRQTDVRNRAEYLKNTAKLFTEHRLQLISLLMTEAGKTIIDAISEVREAEDFLNYYSHQAVTQFSSPQSMPGPTGEDNQLRLTGRGVFISISPWNFPLAIFTGQIAAALVAGNTVIAKPAEQTPLIALFVSQLFAKAGVPENVYQCLPGNGKDIGQALISDPRISGVVFTGSTDTARSINQTLALKPGAIIPLIAETGGINAMIACSSAVPEQLIDDVIMSAFMSAGQRCSALRVLYIQDDIADSTTKMIIGAMNELKIGDPSVIDTDIGPVIDQRAKDVIEAHCIKLQKQGRLLHRLDLNDATKTGTFVAPHLFEIEKLEDLNNEIFGPVLHIIRYQANDLKAVSDQINNAGYGLTLGIHSRIKTTQTYFADHIRAGNVYINRNMIGAVVGVQPFGGQGLSGTGPKAGGPHYLNQFVTEQTITTNTAATGGNTELMSLIE